jgi:hypothetical protein
MIINIINIHKPWDSGGFCLPYGLVIYFIWHRSVKICRLLPEFLIRQRQGQGLGEVKNGMF